MTVHGLKAHAIPMIQAMSVTNNATHITIVTQRMRGGRSEDDTIEDQGRIRAQLHNSDGNVDGVLLEDGTTVDLPDPEAVRLRARLAIGQTVTCAAAEPPTCLAATSRPSLSARTSRRRPWFRARLKTMTMVVAGPDTVGPGAATPATAKLDDLSQM